MVITHRRYFGLYGAGSAFFAFLILLSLRGGGPTDIGTELFVALIPNLVFLVLTCTFYGLAAHSLGRSADFHEAVAATDPRTGLGNTRFFEQRFAAETSLAARHRSALAVLVIDVDSLKQLNDAEGHPAGDRALLLVARALKRIARAEDVVARWGGDEFAIIAPQTSRAEAYALANRLQRAVERLSKSRITISIGVAATERIGWIEPSALFDLADAALYQAKNAGGNRSVLAGHESWNRGVTPQIHPAPGVSVPIHESGFPEQDEAARTLRLRAS